ncbi:MAG: DNA repair protein RecO [Rhodobacteraceae bacterium]|nr:DNA repair protein RecO [Paracoccaceae bacterium]
MEWRDEGILLSVRPHGESTAIIEVFTAAHGRHVGAVCGGTSRKLAPVLQPGTQLQVTWRARLDAHIGAYTVEPLRSRVALLSDHLALSGLNALCALLHTAMPERADHGVLYHATLPLLDAMEQGDDWLSDYLRWEMLLLDELGFGLDLSRCAVTGSRDDLAFVSPKTGRAVSRAGAGDWASRLLPLPQVLMGQGRGTSVEIEQGLVVTGHFLARGIMGLNDRPLPEARARLLALVTRLMSNTP